MPNSQTLILSQLYCAGGKKKDLLTLWDLGQTSETKYIAEITECFEKKNRVLCFNFWLGAIKIIEQ